MPVNRHERNGRSGSNRNYAAMHPEKLALCIRDLRHGISVMDLAPDKDGLGIAAARRLANSALNKDNAWAKCVLKDGDPEVDLIVALEELGRKVYDKP